MGANIFVIFLCIHFASCLDGYYWRNYEPRFTQRIPIDAVVAGKDINQENLFIGQMNIWGFTGIHPTTISAGQKMWTPYQGSQISTTPAPTTYNQNNFGGYQGHQQNPYYSQSSSYQQQPYSGQGYSGQAYSGQPYSGQGYSGQAYSGQPYSVQGYIGQAYGAQSYSGQDSPPTGQTGLGIANSILNSIKTSLNPSVPDAAQWIPTFGSQQPNVNQGNTYMGQMNGGNQGMYYYTTASPVQVSTEDPQTASTFIQVLCSKQQGKFQWISVSSKADLGGITNEVVKGGLDENNFITYIGRVKHQGNIVIGKVLTNDPNNADIIFVFNNQQHRINSYEILTFQN